MSNQSFSLKIYAFGGCDGCAGGTCPTVYRSDDGKFYVQGYAVSEEIRSKVHLDENEILIEVSPELISSIEKNVANDPRK